MSHIYNHAEITSNATISNVVRLNYITADALTVNLPATSLHDVRDGFTVRVNMKNGIKTTFALTDGTLFKENGTTSITLESGYYMFRLQDEEWHISKSNSGTLYSETGIYTGTLIFGGTAAPSGTATNTYYFTKAANLVTFQISLKYSVPGTNVDRIWVPLTGQFPRPVIPPGFTGADKYLWNLETARFIITSTSAVNNANQYYIRRNSLDTDVIIKSVGTTTPANYDSFIISGSYYSE